MYRFIPILFVLLLAPGPGHAQSEPAGESRTSVAWIRAEEVPTRAGVLLRRLEEFQPDTGARSAVEKIAQELPQHDADLDEVLAQASAAVAHSTPFVQLEDLRRELVSEGAPFEAWEGVVAGEAKRVLDQLDEIAQAQRVWSETRGRPETAAR
jgi:hypothetical protein